MSRHPFVGDAAFVLPPEKRDEGFEARKLERLRAVYGLPEDLFPNYQFHASPRSSFKIELHCLLHCFDYYARKLGVNGYGFRWFSHLMMTEDNYLRKDPAYYQQLKHTMELVYVRVEAMALSEDRTTEQKAAKHLDFLAKQVSVCAPGVYTSFNATAQELDEDESEARWLERARQNSIRILREQHVTLYGISEGNSMHVDIRLKKIAHFIGQTISDGEKESLHVDPHEALACIDERTAARYADVLARMTTPDSIVDTLTTNYMEQFSPYRSRSREALVQAHVQSVGQQDIVGEVLLGDIGIEDEIVAGGGGAGEAAVAQAVQVADDLPMDFANLSDADTLVHFQKILKDLQHSQVVYDTNAILEVSDDYSQTWLSPDFVTRLRYYMREHAIRQGYVKSESMIALREFISCVKNDLTVYNSLISDEQRRQTAAMLQQLEALFSLSYRIPMMEFGQEEVVCAYYHQRGEAALAIMRNLAAVNFAEGAITPAGVALSVSIDLYIQQYENQASVECSFEQADESLQLVNAQLTRQARYDELLRMKKAGELISRVTQAAIFKKRYQVMRDRVTANRFRLSTALAEVKQQRLEADPGRAAIALSIVTERDCNQLVHNAELLEPLIGSVNQSLHGYYRVLEGGALNHCDTLYVAATDGSVHLSSGVTISDSGELCVHKPGAEGEGIQQVLIHFLPAESITKRDLLYFMKCRILQDVYQWQIGRDWQPAWLTAANMQQLLNMDFAFCSSKRMQHLLRLLPRVLESLPDNQLTDDVHVILQALITRIFSEGILSEDEVLERLKTDQGRCQLREYASLRQGCFFVRDNVEMLGGIEAVLSADMLSLLRCIDRRLIVVMPSAMGQEILTDRTVRMILILRRLPAEHRENWLQEINQRARDGHLPITIVDSVLCYQKKARSVIRRMGGAGYYTPKQLDEALKQQEIDDIAHSVKIFSDFLTHQSVNAKLFVSISLMIKDWCKPYSKEQVQQLSVIVQVIKYYCTRHMSKRAVQNRTLATQALSDRVSAACKQWNVRIATGDIDAAGVRVFERRMCPRRPDEYDLTRRVMRI